MALWEIVGGADRGGILAREGRSLNSPGLKERLATGAIVEELELEGERLHYKLLEGGGPAEGWISTKVSGKDLAVPQRDAQNLGGPGEAGTVTVDEVARRHLEEEAQMKQREGALAIWLLKYKALGYPLPKPKLRVLCFHNEGSAECNFTCMGSPFVNWAKSTKVVELCAFDYPGRNRMLKQAKLTSIDELVPEMLAVFYDKLSDGVPYVVWGHAVGAWVAFELLVLARRVGLGMPKAGFFMAFPAPHIPVAQRPWHKSRYLNEEQMKEEILCWDKSHYAGAGKVVFDMPTWKDVWEPLMRADFQLFDDYKFKHRGFPKFEFPIHAWHFDGEHKIKPEMVQLWKEWTTGTFDFDVLKGMGHVNCFYKPELKEQYFQKVTDQLKSYLEL
mmetsp:Transcript_52163/g.121321  ORF Transcript_52163/g.121321 Transcript_52163/m.121321 type:complete len:388 (+) Transcript_52163:101-1264(+)